MPAPPAETEEEFNATMDFLTKVKFSEAHIFAYSNRKGTRADTMPGQLPKYVKEERSHRMIELCAASQKEYMESCVGSTAGVLFEREAKEGIYEGHMTNYVKVRAKSEKDISGQILDVKITGTDKDVLLGEIL